MANGKAKWLETTYGKATKKSPERRTNFETTSGVPLDPVYGASPRSDP